MNARLLALVSLLSVAACANGNTEPEAVPFDAGPDGALGGDIGPQDTGTQSPDTCLALKVEAKQLKLTMAVLMDRSGSMQALDKWGSATKAVRTFVDRAEVVGLKFGLQYFPTPGMAESAYCNTTAYKIFAVPVAELPGNVLPIQQSLEKAEPTGSGTPMAAGLAGTIASLQDLTAAQADSEGLVILVTDGEPGPCGDIAAVAAVAKDGATPMGGKKRVRTFAVGMEGANFTSLDTVAAAGSGTKAFDVGSGLKSADALVTALEKIRHDALECEYVLENPKPSEYRIDYTSVDVLFSADGTTSERIKRVGSKDECTEGSGGFYYDNPTTPTRVKLCQSTCEKVRAADQSVAKVQIDLGCVGVIQ